MNEPSVSFYAKVRKITEHTGQRWVTFEGFSSWYEIPPHLDPIICEAIADEFPLVVTFTRAGIISARPRLRGERSRWPKPF
jgi:hypothetical protein